MENRRPETMKRDARTRVVLSAISVSLPSNGKGVERSRGWKGDWNGEWILCPERDIWRPLRPGKNNINIGKERRESFAGWLAGWLARSLALLRAGDIKYNHNNKRPHAERHCWLRHPLARPLVPSLSAALIAHTRR